MTFESPMSRSSDKKLGSAIREQVVRMQRSRKAADDQDLEVVFKNDAERIAVRRSLIGDSVEDPHGFERVIGKSDLCSINSIVHGNRGLQETAGLCHPLLFTHEQVMNSIAWSEFYSIEHLPRLSLLCSAMSSFLKRQELNHARSYSSPVFAKPIMSTARVRS